MHLTEQYNPESLRHFSQIQSLVHGQWNVTAQGGGEVYLAQNTSLEIAVAHA
jgi:hypothetical protein